jgi:hypothetical protein
MITHICDLRIKAAHLSNKVGYYSIPWRCGIDPLHGAVSIKPDNGCQSSDLCSAPEKTTR